MSDTQIKDIPQLKRLIDNSNHIEQLRHHWSWLRPFMKIIGVDSNELEQDWENFEDLKTQLDDLVNLPDRFNDQFGESGWIIYELMDAEAAKEAVHLAESGYFEDAERFLVNHHDSERISWLLNRMKNIDAFKPRMPIAQKALEDYRQGRFHACIPVVLALLDGLVNELHEQQRGFFAEDTNLEAWDSISAHQKGLEQLSIIFRQPRKKTRTDAISIPYRNGILHGRDLGYDNDIVAAKTWAALFATREWALKAERNQLQEEYTGEEESITSALQQIKRLDEEQSRMAGWEPRQIQAGTDIPANGEISDYERGTPERALVALLNYWKNSNYGYMAKYVEHPSFREEEPLPALVREHFEELILKDYEIINLEDKAVSATEVETRLHLMNSFENKDRKKIFTFRLIYQDDDKKPVVRSQAHGHWVIIMWDTIV